MSTGTAETPSKGPCRAEPPRGDSRGGPTIGEVDDRSRRSDSGATGSRLTRSSSRPFEDDWKNDARDVDVVGGRISQGWLRTGIAVLAFAAILLHLLLRYALRA